MIIEILIISPCLKLPPAAFEIPDASIEVSTGFVISSVYSLTLVKSLLATISPTSRFTFDLLFTRSLIFV